MIAPRKFFVALLSSLVLFLGCNQAKKSGQVDRTSVKEPMTVNTIDVELAERVSSTAVFYGKIEPSQSLRLGFGRPGTLKSIVRVGDRLSPGAILAQLDNEELLSKKSNLQDQLKQNQLNDSPEVRATNATLTDQLQSLDATIRQGEIIAPFESVVSEIFVHEGSLVRGQTPVIQVIEYAAPSVKIDLPRNIAGQIGKDDTVQIVIGDYSTQCQLLRKAIDVTPAGSRTVWFQVDTELSNVPWSFGQTVEVRFLLSTDESGYWVPLSSLAQSANGVWSVFSFANQNEDGRQTGTVIERKLVEVIRVEEPWVLVSGGFSGSVRIVADGIHRVVPGQIVNQKDVSSQYRIANTVSSDVSGESDRKGGD